MVKKDIVLGGTRYNVTYEQKENEIIIHSLIAGDKPMSVNLCMPSVLTLIKKKLIE